MSKIKGATDMAFETKNFIIDLAMQLNLNNMDDATRARLTDLQKKHVATKKQLSWKPGEDAPAIDAIDNKATPPVYKYNGEPVTGGTKPSASDLNDLYLKLVLVLRDMAADKELSSEDPVKSFLNDFYGADKAVETFTISPIDLSGPNDAKDIAKYIRSNLTDYTSFFNEDIKEKDLKSLADALDSGSYISDSKALKTLDKFLGRIAHYYQWDNSKPLPSKDMPTCLKLAGAGPADLDISNIDSIRKQLKKPIIPASLDKLNEDAPKLFGKLISNDKLFEKFSEKDEDGDLRKWISKGISETNYKSGDDALAPKYDDRKQFWDDAKAKVKDWYVDTLGKLEQKHTRHLYTTNARYIVAGLIGKGVKPTDGTGKILDTLDAINGDLPNPVQKQVKWIKDTLKKMKGTNFFKDALRDGDQMRQLVQEIIKAAAHDGKKEEAKVALEMLAVMRYTLTTSSVRDQLKKTEFKLFSDSSLSFNKGNKFMQSMTNALDRTLKFGMMATFEAGNFVKNSIKQQGLKFGDGTQNLDKRTTDSIEYKNGGDKQQIMEELFAFWDFVNSSANTKDYNIFQRHSNVQEKQDAINKDKITVNLTAGSLDLEHNTNQQKQFLEYLRDNNIGRAA